MTDQVAPPQDPADPLDQLQAENDSLRQQIEDLRATAEDAAGDERLDAQRRANERLREELASTSLSEALRSAAGELGIDPDLAMLQATRFDCTVDDTGAVRITPNPTETFLKLAKTDPLFRRADPAVKDGRDEGASIAAATAVDESDAVDLVGYLDRNPARRYEFIRRHGRDKFFELIRAAKRRGYRRAGR